jgi:hypothetical protein
VKDREEIKVPDLTVSVVVDITSQFGVENLSIPDDFVKLQSVKNKNKARF